MPTEDAEPVYVVVQQSSRADEDGSAGNAALLSPTASPLQRSNARVRFEVTVRCAGVGTTARTGRTGVLISGVLQSDVGSLEAARPSSQLDFATQSPRAKAW